MALTHTLKLSDGSIATRKSATRRYVAAVVMTRTQAAFEAVRKDYAQASARAQSKVEAEYAKLPPGKTVEQWCAEADPLKAAWDRGNGTYEAMCAHPAYLLSCAVSDLRGVQRRDAANAKEYPVGFTAVNSWHMTQAQAEKTAFSKSSSMFHAHALDKVEIRTDIEVKGSPKA